MSCLHVNYDDYFERCIDCDMSGQELHAEQCDKPLVFSDAAGCWRCYSCDAWLDNVDESAA